jgi:membrane protein YdbS with pleckstrin-like domain
MDGPFDAPPDHPWTRVSPRLARMRRTLLLVVGIPVVVACSVPVAGASGAGAAAIGAAGVVVLVAGWISVGRNLRSWGYAERSDDLVITHGALFKTLCVVPYGRMQLVDVEAGPIERSFGLVHVKLHTAAATTDAKVCGLAPATASALRDRLTQLGEAHASGL